MSCDLQLIRDIGAPSVAMVREHAIFIEAQRSDRRVQKARNLSEVLERNHKRSKGNGLQAQLIDIKA